MNKTLDGYKIFSPNRIPPGYTIYPTGVADNITNGTYGDGNKIKLSSSITSVDFQMLNHWYAVGGIAIWENAHIDCYLQAKLIAPATTGLTNQAGDFDKTEIIPSSGLHIITPNPTPGSGAWDMDLTATLPNTQILKAVPVPQAGNNGWFNYDKDNNTITVNPNQTGGYNLYDFDINLFAFCRYCWGRGLNGGETRLEIPGVVGKVLFNSWKIKFEFKHDGGSLTTEKVGIDLITAVKKNI